MQADSIYIARAPMVVGRGGKQVAVLPGETIPDFASWPYMSQRAMLNLGRVEKVGAHLPANLKSTGGYLHFEDPPLPEPAAPEAVGKKKKTSKAEDTEG